MTTIESLKEENLRLKEAVKNLADSLEAKTLKGYRIQAYFYDNDGCKWFFVYTRCTDYSETGAHRQLDRLAANKSKHVKTSIYLNVERVDFEKKERTLIDDLADKFL